MIKPQQETLHDIMNEINAKLKEFKALLLDASKSEKPSSIMFMYSPSEWEQISITLMHYDYAMKKFPKGRPEDELIEWAKNHSALFAYIRDMVSSWYDRIDKKAEIA